MQTEIERRIILARQRNAPFLSKRRKRPSFAGEVERALRENHAYLFNRSELSLTALRKIWQERWPNKPWNYTVKIARAYYAKTRRLSSMAIPPDTADKDARIAALRHALLGMWREDPAARAVAERVLLSEGMTCR